MTGQAFAPTHGFRQRDGLLTQGDKPHRSCQLRTVEIVTEPDIVTEIMQSLNLSMGRRRTGENDQAKAGRIKDWDAKSLNERRTDEGHGIQKQLPAQGFIDKIRQNHARIGLSNAPDLVAVGIALESTGHTEWNAKLMQTRFTISPQGKQKILPRLQG